MAVPPWPVDLCYSAINCAVVIKIRDGLATSGLVKFVEPEDCAVVNLIKAAISKSALVLVAVSEALKSTSRRQLEVDYAVKLGTPMVSVIVQHKYRPDGWLHRLLDLNTVVFDLSKRHIVDSRWQKFTDGLSVQQNKVSIDYMVDEASVEEPSLESIGVGNDNGWLD